MIQRKIPFLLSLSLLLITQITYPITTAPYGSWHSPITAAAAVENSVNLAEPKIVNGTIYWLEGRPKEGGRVALMAWNKQDGEQELLPQHYSVRNRVHEYGGGALLVAKDTIYFVNDHDQQIYCLKQGTISQVTHHPTARFADGCAHPLDGSLFYIMEDHGPEVINSLVKIDPATGVIESIATGNDFYSHPRISPDGKQLAYITWNHPYLPWDHAQLWVIDLAIKTDRWVAGNGPEAVTDPHWSPEGQLYYVSDRNNWWNLYKEGNADPVLNAPEEYAEPQWWLGCSTIAFCDAGIFCSPVKNGAHHFVLLHNEPATICRELSLPYTSVLDIATENNLVAFVAKSPSHASALRLYDLNTGNEHIIKKSSPKQIDLRYASQPEAIEFPTVGNRTAHAFYYPPCNPDFEGPEDELPPLLVLSHGGPTANVNPVMALTILYWTSRGFAVVDVNYGGSTGYGREYRDRLNGQWGIVDVDDCTHAALYCVEQGLADPSRLAIAGGSAGGFTTLAALTFRDVFKVGANYYGLSDLDIFVHDTHKFESRYLDQLVGPYPESRDVYLERSPLYSVEQITCPIIIFQGDEDKIVPPSQSELIYNSLLRRGIPTAYFLYQGEQHGFRKAENIQRSLEAQLYFFSKILGFPLSEEIDPVAIDNFEEN